MEFHNDIEQIADKVTQDKDFAAKFNENPEKTVEALLGKRIIREAVSEIVEGVREVLEVDMAEEAIEEINKKSMF